jgi:hypothetical protein
VRAPQACERVRARARGTKCASIPDKQTQQVRFRHAAPSLDAGKSPIRPTFPFAPASTGAYNFHSPYHPVGSGPVQPGVEAERPRDEHFRSAELATHAWRPLNYALGL